MSAHAMTFIWGLLGSLVFVGGCGLGGGPGNFDRAAKATKASGNMVRFYDECPLFNTSSGTGSPACIPPSAPSAYNFGPKGTCSFKATAVHEKICEGDPAASCNDVKMSVKCSDIRQPGGNPVTAGADSGWFLRVKYRATIADINGDMTLSDVELDIPMTTTDGKLSLVGKPFFDAITAIQNMMAAEYVGPLNLQIVDVAIKDPGTNTFAVPGFSSGA